MCHSRVELPAVTIFCKILTMRCSKIESLGFFLTHPNASARVHIGGCSKATNQGNHGQTVQDAGKLELTQLRTFSSS